MTFEEATEKLAGRALFEIGRAKMGGETLDEKWRNLIDAVEAVDPGCGQRFIDKM